MSYVSVYSYPQIEMVRGVVQDWGLVEFFDPEDAEATQVKLNGRCIRGQPIRIQYCIPGVRAINIHNEVTKCHVTHVGLMANNILVVLSRP